MEKTIIRKQKETLKTRIVSILMAIVPIIMGGVLVFTSPFDFHGVTIWNFLNILQGVFTGVVFNDYGTGFIAGVIIFLIGMGYLVYTISSFFRKPKAILTIDKGGLKHCLLPLIPWNFINRVENERNVISLELENNNEAQQQLLSSIAKKIIKLEEDMKYNRDTPPPPFFLEEIGGKAMLQIELDLNLPNETIETALKAIYWYKPK